MVIERIRNLLCILLSIIFFLSGSIAYPYDTKEGGHIGISRKSIELKINLHGGDELSQELGAYGREIIDGNVNEDWPIAPTPFWLRHFYNPRTGKGLWGRYTPAPEHAKVWYEIAKKEYCNGFKPAAWKALGHVLHLIQDVTVPAHSHGTAHWPPRLRGLPSQNQSYESYIVDNWDIWINNYLNNYPLQNRQLSDLQSYFDEAANESYNYPFDSNIPKYRLTPEESESTAKALVPLAVEYGAGLLNTFWDDLQREECAPKQPGPGRDHPDDRFDVSESIYLYNKFDLNEMDYMDMNLRVGIKKGRVNLHYDKILIQKLEELRSLPETTPSEEVQQRIDEINIIKDKITTSIDEDYEISPDVALLTEGFFEDTTSLLLKNKEPFSFKDVNFSPEIIKHKPLLLIPTGGLYGLENSEFFKASLDEYVKSGGTLIVFSQQHGYEYSVIPTPDGKPITGYGWVEDQSCLWNGTYIDTYHPILSSINTSTVTANVDGYFTSYPDNSTILLRRTSNGQPAMLMYEYGQGRVILTTMYTDWAYGHSQSTAQGRSIVRDMVSWAKAPATLSEVKPGETVNLNIEVSNFTDTDATSIKLTILDPDRNIVTEQMVSTPVSAGQTTTIPFTYTTQGSAPLGIYHIDYTLLDASGTVIQPQAEADTGRFVVSSPPENPYRARDLQYAINTPGEEFISGRWVPFTLSIWNNSDRDKRLRLYWDWSHRAAVFLDEVVVPAGGSIVKDYSVDLPYRANSVERLWVHFYEEGGSAVRKPSWVRVWNETWPYVGSYGKGIRVIALPSADVEVQTDKSFYGRSGAVSITTSLKSNTTTNWQAGVKITVIDPSSTLIFEDTRTIALPSYGSGSVESGFTLPPDADTGTYTVRVEVLYESERISTASTRFEVVQSQIEVTPTLPTAFTTGTNTVSFTLTNRGKVGVSSGVLSLSLKDPEGVEVYTGTQAFSLGVGESMVLDIPVDIPALKFGDYVLTYTQSDETRTGSPASITIPNTATIALTLDKPSYRIRETANLTVDLTNTGEFNQDNVSVTVSVPDAGYTDTKTLSLPTTQNSQLTYSIPIPETVIAGQHDVEVTLTLPSGGSMVQDSKFTVPESSLVIGYTGTTSLTAGDTLTLTIENTGGVDTGYTTERLTITDSRGVEIYQGSIAGSILAGEKKTLTDIQIPSQSVSGLLFLNVWVKDDKTGKMAYFSRFVENTGVSASLQVETSKDAYLKTEAITGLLTLVNNAFGIENGSMDVKVIEYKETAYGGFSLFLPKTGWGPIEKPGDIAVGQDRAVYVIDSSIRFYGGEAATRDYYILGFDGSGRFIAKWGSTGSGDGQFESPEAIAVAPDGLVYVADSGNNRIQKFDSSGNFIAKWGSAGSGDGQFNYPKGIAIGPDGSVYVADTYNHRIQKFDSNGNFITKWGSYGSGDGQFDKPWGIAVSPDGFVYVADSGNSRIQKFDSNGNFITKWGSYGGGDGQFYAPKDITIAPDGSVYVSEWGYSDIQKFDSNGNFISKWWDIGSGGQHVSPQGIGASPEGSIYITTDNRILTFDDNLGIIATWRTYGSDNGQFYYPYGVAIGPDGSVYVADTYNHRIQKFDKDGNFITQWGGRCYTDSDWDGIPDQPCEGQFNYPQGIAIGVDGSVYVADTYNHRIQKFDGNGNFIAQWGSRCYTDSDWDGIPDQPCEGQFASPQGIAIGPDGSVYVADTSNNRIQKFDSNGNFIAQWGSKGSGDGQFFWTSGIAMAQDGSVCVADYYNHRIQKFDSNGNFITKWGSYGGGDGQFSHPYGVAVGQDGYIFVSDSGNNRIQKFDSSGNFIAKWGSAGSGDGQFNYPYGIAIGPDGSVYVADTYNHRIQRMVSGGVETLFETTLPITQPADTTRDYTVDIGTLNTTGKLYLEATLTNSLGQVVARDTYPFYIVEGDTVLLFDSDKQFYRPGETVTITGEVRNLAGIDASALSLQLLAGSENLYTATFDLPAGGSYPFTVTTTADRKGVVTLRGTVTQNNSTLVEVTDRYEVVDPEVTVSITAPDVVGKDPFGLSVEIENPGKVEAGIQYSLVSSKGETIDTRTLTVPAGERRSFQYTLQIGETTTYSVEVTGDVTLAVTRQVVYGEAVVITLGAGGIYPEGRVSVPVTIANTGLLDEAVDVEFILSTQGVQVGSERRTYYIPQGGSVTDTLYFDLTEGDYQLSALSLQPNATVQAGFTVAKEDDVAMALEVGSQGTDGLIPVTVSLTNNGYNDITGSLILDSGFWRGEQAVELLSGQTLNRTFGINPAGATPGTYVVTVTLYNTSGQEIETSSLQLTITGADLEITRLPGYQTFAAGQEGSFSFTVRNTGNQEGEVSFSLKVMDLLDQTITEWLKPGEEKEFTFTFLLPEDLEEKDYFADYELRGGEGVVDKGKVKFHLAGLSLAVDATLDKQSYSTGDTARLTLEITDTRVQPSPIDLIARVNYAGYEGEQAFTLSGSTVLNFDIPLREITGEKLFYGIYFGSGRSIHLNSLYIYSAEEAIVIATDRQVYDPGETVSVTLTGDVAGTMTLTGPGGYEETFDFTGSATRSLVLPQSMVAGTYYIGAQLTTPDGEVITGSHPIDIAGIQVKVKSASLDRPKYASTDTLSLGLTIESNEDLSAVLKVWVVDPAGGYTKVGEEGITLTSTEPLLFANSYSLTTAFSGIHRLVYGIYSGDLLLSSGSEAFDVGDAVVMGLSTDRMDYPTIEEPVDVEVNLYGTAGVDLALILDGETVKREVLSLTGFSTYTTQLAGVSPGPHTLKAVLTAGGLTSTKEVGFVYGSSLPDLTVVLSSQGEVVGGNTIRLIATVMNQGKTPAPAGTLDLYDGDPDAGGTLIASLNLPALEAGAGTTLTYDWGVLGKAGDHTVYGVVDPEGTVVEFNEENNRAWVTVSIPDLVLRVSTLEVSYRANEEVGIRIDMVNLTPDVTYTGLGLRVELTDPEGGTTVLRDEVISSLGPALETTTAINWNTGSNPPGEYTIHAELIRGAETLADGTTIFTIEPTPSLTGGFTLDKEEVIQGFPLAIDYTLTNNGNIDLAGGEVEAAFVEVDSGMEATAYTQGFGAIAVLETLSQTLEIEKVEVEPGDYRFRLTAQAGGETFIIGEAPIKVLPPLEVTKGLSTMPRVLVLMDREKDERDKKDKDREDKENGHRKHGTKGLTRTIVKEALDGMGVYYRMVEDKRDFREEMRRGTYNVYILTGREPLPDHLDEELTERINSGEGLILLNYEKIEDKKFRELTGVKSKGHLSRKARVLTLLESPFTEPGTLSIGGKVQKLEVESEEAIIAGTVEDRGRTYPGIILNPYGRGRVVVFAFDIGESAEETGQTSPYTGLLQNVAGYVTPVEAEAVAGTPLAMGTGFKSLGTEFDLKVVEYVDDALSIELTYPEGVIDQQVISWRFQLIQQEERDLLYLVKLPEERGTYTLSTEVYYLKDGSYEPYDTYPFTIEVDRGVVEIEMAILTGLKALEVEGRDREELDDIIEEYEEVIDRASTGEKGVEKAIKGLIEVIEDLKELEADTTGIRLDMDRLLKVYERRWVEERE